MENPDPSQYNSPDAHLQLFLLLPFLKAAISGQGFGPPSVWIVQLLQELITSQAIYLTWFRFLLPLVFLSDASQNPITQSTPQGILLKRRMVK